MSHVTTETERRLQEEEIAWLTTVRADGQPQSVPVWFLWDVEGFLVDFSGDTHRGVAFQGGNLRHS